MLNCSFVLLLLTFSQIFFCQEITVYQDVFSNANSGTSGPYSASVNGVSPNNTKWHYTETDGGFSVAYEFASSEMRLINNYNTDDSYGTAFLNKRLGGSLTPIGSNGVYGTYLTSNSNYIKDDFTNNTQNLEWTFLFYISHANYLGLSNGGTYYGGAFILGAEYNNITMCSTALRNTGYAVVFASNNIQLVRFTSGTGSACATNNYPQYLLNNTFTYNSNTCVISDNSASLVGGRWYAVKVQYNPSNDQWRLFTRHNVASSFDPTTLASTDGRGAAVDNTYTSNYLTYMGLYASLPPENSTYGTRSVRMKSLKVKKNVALLSTPAGSGACAGIVALPVEFNQFTVNCINSEFNLKWSTFTESNNDYFTIERSTDGSVFEEVKKIIANGTTSQLTMYEWLDERPLPGTSYYRLSQTDFNGQKTVLATLSSEWPCKDQSDGIRIFPNPTEGDVNLLISRYDGEDYSVHVCNSFGQTVIPSIEVEGKEKGVTQLRLRTSEIPSGVYLIKVILGEKVFTERLLIKE